MKFKTHNDKNISSCGTSLAGCVDVSYKKLLKVFGEPIYGSADYKTDVQWELEFEDGTVATVYNYKDGIAYCGESGAPVEKIRDWHIGGTRRSVELVRAALGLKTKRTTERIREVLRS